MTDVPQNWKQHLYISRAGVHRNRPAVIGVNVHGFDSPIRVELHKRAESQGLSAFYLLDEELNAMEAELPDMLGMNQQQIDAVPEFVRYFKCKNELEKDEPGCQDHKYNEGVCPNRRGKGEYGNVYLPN
jgi:hypothetical protein